MLPIESHGKGDPTGKPVLNLFFNNSVVTFDDETKYRNIFKSSFLHQIGLYSPVVLNTLIQISPGSLVGGGEGGGGGGRDLS
jgi:hypothetical protein